MGFTEENDVPGPPSFVSRIVCSTKNKVEEWIPINYIVFYIACRHVTYSSVTHSRISGVSLTYL